MKVRTFRRIVVMGIINHFLSGTYAFALKRRLLKSVGYQIGEETKIVGPIFCTGTLVIGKDCWIGRNFSVYGNGCVEIKDRCDIAPDVSFFTGGHRIGTHDRRAGEGECYSITIGNGTWIGAQSMFCKNISVGDGCVIASGSNVISNQASDWLVGGVPAKQIRSLGHESEHIVEK